MYKYIVPFSHSPLTKMIVDDYDYGWSDKTMFLRDPFPAQSMSLTRRLAHDLDS
jgi:hypothetical protein